MSTMSGRDIQPAAGRRPGRRWSMAAAAVLLVSAFVLVVQAAGFQRYLVESWVESLDRQSGIQLRISHYSWQWPLRLVVDGVEMHRHGRKMLQCDRATITLRPCLERPFWYVAHLALDRPFFYLEKDLGGRWMSTANRPDGQPPPVPAPSGGRVPDSTRSIIVRVESGTIVADQDGQRVLKIGNVAGQLTLPYDGAAGMNVLLANLDSLRPATPRGLGLGGARK